MGKGGEKKREGERERERGDSTGKVVRYVLSLPELLYYLPLVPALWLSSWVDGSAEVGQRPGWSCHRPA